MHTTHTHTHNLLILSRFECRENEFKKLDEDNNKKVSAAEGRIRRRRILCSTGYDLHKYTKYERALARLPVFFEKWDKQVDGNIKSNNETKGRKLCVLSQNKQTKNTQQTNFKRINWMWWLLKAHLQKALLISHITSTNNSTSHSKINSSRSLSYFVSRFCFIKTNEPVRIDDFVVHYREKSTKHTYNILETLDKKKTRKKTTRYISEGETHENLHTLTH